MFVKKFIEIVIGISSLLMLSSCGSDNAGGGAGEFTTVIMTAAAKTIRFESDVITGNTCANNVSTGGTFATDSVDVDLTSTKYPNLTIPALPVRVVSAIVSYAPRNSVSPAIPAQPFSVPFDINPGTTTIQVPVVPEILKIQLVNNFNLQLCSSTVYEYYVTITFTGTEIGGSGPSRDFSTNMNIAIADRQ